jgi:hypothetical protein
LHTVVGPISSGELLAINRELSIIRTGPPRAANDRRCSTFLQIHSDCNRMIQTGLIQNAHNDLVTDVAYDFYGLRLATCSLDQRYLMSF